MKITELKDLRLIDIGLHKGKLKEEFSIGTTPEGEKVLVKFCQNKDKSCLKTKIACYQNRVVPNMPRLYGFDLEEEYLIIEFFEELQELTPTVTELEALVETACTQFVKIDPAILPPRGVSWVTKPIIERAREIQFQGLINDQEKVIAEYQELKPLIDAMSKQFAHGDYISQNMKKTPAGKIVIMDWELARKDSVFHDMAALYIELALAPKQRKLLQSILANRQEYNKEAFRLIVWVRAIALVYALRNLVERLGTEVRPFKTGLETLKAFNTLPF